MKRLFPDTVAARTMVVLIVGLTVSHMLSMAFYFNDRESELMFAGGEHIGERIATIMRLIENAAPTERQRIVELADDLRLHIRLSNESAIQDQKVSNWRMTLLRDALFAHLNRTGARAFRLRLTDDLGAAWRTQLHVGGQAPEIGETLLVSLQLSDRNWLDFAAPIESRTPFWSLRFALSVAVMLAAVVLLSALVVHYLTRPLSALALAAHRFGADVRAPPTPESGPFEVRQVTRAFNDMQRRLRRFVEDRTQMLAAISHDLGTPITRLRLRAEFVEDEEQRRKMLADLDDMEKMVSSALSFVRNEAINEPRVMVDFRTLLQRVCDDMADAGGEITLDAGDAAAPYGCRPAALRRALTDLVDNAVKYGGLARVSLEVDHRSIRIRIEDDGPGITERLQEDAFRPFRRLEASRNRETGGTGLGLTIARSIIRAHGGDIALSNRTEGGLRVNVSLPR